MNTRLSDLEQLVYEIKKFRPDCKVAIDYCATLSLTLFFHMEKKDGTYDNREVYVHGFPIKL